jgi:hypothetical protein
MEETLMSSMPARKLSRPAEYDVEDDDALYDTRLPTSTRRYKSIPPLHQESDDEHSSTRGTLIQRRRSSLSSRHTTSGIASDAVAPTRIEPKQRTRSFPLSAVLVGMVFTVVLIMALSTFLSWWKIYQDDIHYGRPRTSQIDAVVGHNDSPANPTHFIFINLNRHVQIIEIAGGDASHAHIYPGPVLYGNGEDLSPVTGEVRDVNGDGKADLIIHIQDQQFIYLNDGSTFQAQRN